MTRAFNTQNTITQMWKKLLLFAFRSLPGRNVAYMPIKNTKNKRGNAYG